LVSEQQPEPAKKPEKKAKAREIKPAVVIDAETGKPEPTKGGDEPCANQSAIKCQERDDSTQSAASVMNAVASNAATTVQPGTAAIQTELDFTVQITAADEDRQWFESLTSIERGRVIARARQQP